VGKSEQEREFRNKTPSNKTPKNEGQHALNSRLPLVVGRSQHHQTTEDDVSLNWTGLDHVANLTEIHLHDLIFLKEFGSITD